MDPFISIEFGRELLFFTHELLHPFECKLRFLGIRRPAQRIGAAHRIAYLFRFWMKVRPDEVSRGDELHSLQVFR